MNACDSRVVDGDPGTGFRGDDVRIDVDVQDPGPASPERLAVVYVRQSSPQQVLENRESRERQYALAQFARRLGWSARCGNH